LVATLEKMPPFSVAIKVFVILIVAARQSGLVFAGVALWAGRPGPFACSAARRR
jgi:hypothetical protein